MTSLAQARRLVSIVGTARRAAAIAALLTVAACGSGDQTSSGSGGSTTTGGNMGSGGVGSGGAVGSGGSTSATGGTVGSGGRQGATGGTAAPGTGGASSPGTGGTAGQGSGSTGAAAGGGGRGASPGSAGAGASHSGGAGGDGRASGGAGGAGRGGSGVSGAAGAGGLGPEAPGRVTGYGTVLISANAKNQIVRLQTTLLVPPQPPASGTLFLWPGLQPDGANFEPIDNGVLQPVLTWGPSCAPGKAPRSYSTWWISGQYVNTNGHETGYTGCLGGPIMSVAVGDSLDIDIALAGTTWTQTVTDLQSGQSVSYALDLMNQAQNLAYFVIEEYSSAPVSDVVFTNTTITFGAPDAADCRLTMRGQNDFVSVPVASSDGRSCVIPQIILRAQGVP